MRSHLPRAGYDAVNQFEPENVGAVFLEPAIPINDRRRKKRHSIDQQEQDRERSPVMHSIDPPALTPAIQDEIQQTISKVKRQQQNGCKEEDPIANVIQNVVPRFVPEDEKSFLR